MDDQRATALSIEIRTKRRSSTHGENTKKSEVTKELKATLEGLHIQADPMSEFLKKAKALVFQELLEQETTNFSGRENYQRPGKEDNHSQSGYRNGRESRILRTSEGKAMVFLPQVRGTDIPFRTKLRAFLKGIPRLSRNWSPRCTLWGFLPGTLKMRFLKRLETNKVLSRTKVSEVTEVLREEFEASQN
ncbi:MAG: transposase [Candidatus Atribacteria bacterium]|nr:transposase [Candidatus Atribacteria bacterium]